MFVIAAGICLCIIWWTFSKDIAQFYGSHEFYKIGDNGNPIPKGRIIFSPYEGVWQSFVPLYSGIFLIFSGLIWSNYVSKKRNKLKGMQT